MNKYLKEGLDPWKDRAEIVEVLQQTASKVGSIDISENPYFYGETKKYMKETDKLLSNLKKVAMKCKADVDKIYKGYKPFG